MIEKIVILSGNVRETSIIYNYINPSFPISLVLFEKSVSKMTFFKRRIKNLGFLFVLGQILFFIYNKIFMKSRSKHRINELLSSKSIPSGNINCNIHNVDSVNDAEVIRKLSDINPDVVIINGTRILSKELLESISCPFINIHAGITPSYRGVHGGYWSIFDDDKSNFGVTVHLVDAGIDTGSILYQDFIDVDVRDNINTYPFVQLCAALPLLLQCLFDIESNSLIKKKVSGVSKIWSHPTLFQYLYGLIFKGVR